MQPEYKHEILDLPLDVQDIDVAGWTAAREQAAVIVRKVLWLGRGVPNMQVRGRPWSMGRELSIWKQLALFHHPVKVNGALSVARDTLGIPGGEQFTLLIFYGKGKRHVLNGCIQHYERQVLRDGGADRAASILKSMLGGSR
jgi:hypothetical protein